MNIEIKRIICKGLFLVFGGLIVLLLFESKWLVEHGRVHSYTAERDSGGIQSSQDRYNSLFEIENCVTDCLSGNRIRCSSEDQNTQVYKALSGKDLEDHNQRQEAFERVYNKKEWIHSGDKLDPRFKDVQGSGAGSTLEWSQEAIGTLHLVITELKRVLNKETITMLDIPCGDMVWMQRFLQTRSDIEYVGMDIVPHLIASHTKRYAGFKQWTFLHQDIVAKPLNRSFDLIFSRMMLQHLATKDVGTILQHFQDSGSRYFLTTTFPTVGANPELPVGVAGRFRFLNLEIAPFYLSSPICMTRDGDTTQRYHYLALWKLPLMSHVTCKGHTTKMLLAPHSEFHLCS